MKEVIIRFDQKNRFFQGWSWFNVNNLGLALGTNLRFYTSVAIGLILKVKTFLGLIPTFVKVRSEKLVGGPVFFLFMVTSVLRLHELFALKLKISLLMGGKGTIFTLYISVSKYFIFL